MEQILNMTQNNWVSFRDFNGKKLIYLTMRLGTAKSIAVQVTFDDTKSEIVRKSL